MPISILLYEKAAALAGMLLKFFQRFERPHRRWQKWTQLLLGQSERNIFTANTSKPEKIKIKNQHKHRPTTNKKKKKKKKRDDRNIYHHRSSITLHLYYPNSKMVISGLNPKMIPFEEPTTFIL